MRNPTEVTNILNRVQEYLNKSPLQLRVSSNRIDDGWLVIAVATGKSEVGAYDIARALSGVEKKLHEEGEEQLILVPDISEL